MEIHLSPFVRKELRRINQKDKKLAKKIEKQLLIFANNPRHPSLRTHKLTRKKEQEWSIPITMSFRMIYKILDNNIAYFSDIGNHDEVYGK